MKRQGVGSRRRGRTQRRHGGADRVSLGRRGNGFSADGQRRLHFEILEGRQLLTAAAACNSQAAPAVAAPATVVAGDTAHVASAQSGATMNEYGGGLDIQIIASTWHPDVTVPGECSRHRPRQDTLVRQIRDWRHKPRRQRQCLGPCHHQIALAPKRRGSAGQRRRSCDCDLFQLVGRNLDPGSRGCGHGSVVGRNDVGRDGWHRAGG